MNKRNDEKFYKAKGFYLCLCTGLFAVLAMVAVQGNLNKEKSKIGLTDLNEPAVEQNNAAIATKNSEVAQKPEALSPIEEESNLEEQNTVKENNTSDMEAAENQQEKKEEQDKKTETKEDKKDKKSEKTEEEADKEKTVSVMSNEAVGNKKVSYEDSQGLLWPITGNVIMKYSMDKSIYFSTLGQYKCNPAIMISGVEGDKVKCAADCKVLEVKTNEETGLTVVTDIGEYQLIYGQLKDVAVKAGDSLKAGQTIGYLAKPTKYYTMEGCNLYFKVMDGKESVNPLLLLR